ncbi:MAG: DUF350 domain-containing protein [Bdellovibrio sp.]|nr:DUF350 domain-containing protein [Bdellovibrio sp.]
MEDLISIKYIVGAVVYSGLGLVILAIVWKVFDWMTPGVLWVEIIEKKNTALAITVGAVTIAVAQIIASAIHG